MKGLGGLPEDQVKVSQLFKLSAAQGLLAAAEKELAVAYRSKDEP
jgi:hypothetical protein